MTLPYRSAGLGGAAAASQTDVIAVQHDLRSLGYLAAGIDGVFGDGSRKAIRALQYDLLHNTGASTAHDGSAPVAVMRYNRGVVSVTGVVDPQSADSIEAMLADPSFPKIPRSNTPASDNRAVLAQVAATRSTVAPIPFLLAIFQQESSGRHYAVPQHGNTDDFVIIGLDHNDQGSADHITSRGYGLGQYTLFHHPPRLSDLQDFVLSPANNVVKAEGELADKFAHFLTGTTPGTQAEERRVDHPIQQALRPCRYKMSDPRYLSDCRACAQEARKLAIGPSTPLYAGSAQTYGQAKNYASPHYTGVPDRADFKCDWPYAARRYNGRGPDSYNYQARILRNLLSVTAPQNGA